MPDEKCPLSAISEKVVKTLTRSEVKREAIVDAARAVFLSKGFDIASMDLIAAEANVSKRTVYGHFQSKEKLFAHIMKDMCSRKLPDLIGEEGPDTSDVLRFDRPIEESLIEFAERFLNLVFDPDAISLLRILIGQASNFPEIGREHFNQGPKETISFLSQFLKDADKKGIIKVAEPEIAAEIFLSSLLGAPHVECLTTACPSPDKGKMQLMVKTTVEIFLRGVLVNRA